MRPNDPVFWIFTLVISGVVGFSYQTYLGLEAEIAALHQKINALELQGARQSRMAIVTVAPKNTSTLRDRVYRSLQTINDVHSPEDSKKEKRVLLQQNLLSVKDPQAASEDAFFDLLGSLMDEDLIEQIQVPDPAKVDPALRAFYRSVRQELIRFGVPPESLSSAPGGDLIVVLKKSV